MPRERARSVIPVTVAPAPQSALSKVTGPPGLGGANAAPPAVRRGLEPVIAGRYA